MALYLQGTHSWLDLGVTGCKTSCGLYAKQLFRAGHDTPLSLT